MLCASSGLIQIIVALQAWALLAAGVAALGLYGTFKVSMSRSEHVHHSV